MLSKKESKFRQKIFAKYHLDKLAQIAFDKQVKKLNQSYKSVYLLNKVSEIYFIPKYGSLRRIISGNAMRRIFKDLKEFDKIRANRNNFKSELETKWREFK